MTDPLVWKDLTLLVEQMRKLNAKQLGKTSPVLHAEDIAAFLTEEQTEAEL